MGSSVNKRGINCWHSMMYLFAACGGGKRNGGGGEERNVPLSSLGVVEEEGSGICLFPRLGGGRGVGDGGGGEAGCAEKLSIRVEIHS